MRLALARVSRGAIDILRLHETADQYVGPEVAARLSIRLHACSTSIRGSREDLGALALGLESANLPSPYSHEALRVAATIGRALERVG